MESSKFVILVLTYLVIAVNGQISTPCTNSLISNFTPCLNFVTGSSNNGTSPTKTCCNALKSLTSTSMDCACLLITASVPVPLPISRILAISLPRACGMSVPIQCKASGSPLPAPGPVLLGPTLPPPAASPLSPIASKAVAEAPAPEFGTTFEAPAPEFGTTFEPASPPDTVEAHPATGGSRQEVKPSAAMPQLTSQPISLLLFVAFLVFKHN